MQRARAARLDGAIRYTVGDTSHTASILIDAARGYGTVRRARRPATRLLQALAAARVTGAFTAPGESELDVALAATSDAAAAGVRRRRSVTSFWTATARCSSTATPPPAPLLRRADRRPRRRHPDSEEVLCGSGSACWAAGALGDEEALYRLAVAWSGRRRRHGRSYRCRSA